MLNRCIYDEFNGFKWKVNTKVYWVGRKFLHRTSRWWLCWFLHRDTSCFYWFQYSLYFQSQRSKKQFQGKKPQKQRERKDVVTKDIRSFFGGSTIVKLSGPLKTKEKEIIKIDWRKNVYFFLSFSIGFIA